MADRQGRYRRGDSAPDDDDDDDSASLSSLSTTPPPRKPNGPGRPHPERDPRQRIRNQDRYMDVNPPPPPPPGGPGATHDDLSSPSPPPPPPPAGGDRHRDRRSSRDPRDSMDPRASSHVRGPRDSRDPRDRDFRDPRDPRDHRDSSRYPRDRDDSPPPTPPPAAGGNRRQSLTDRLRNSWHAKKDEFLGATGHQPTPPPNAASGRPPSRMPSRRGSSAGAGAAAAAGGGLGKATPIAKVREWLETCNHEHGTHCYGSPVTAGNRPETPDSFDSAAESAMPRSGEPGTWRPIWLIDSTDRRLVRARAGDNYLALSYVYEKPSAPSPTARAPVKEARRENVDMLTASLDEADMPQAIADGIWLARKLNIRLVWIDRFCIVQDDEAEREEYIRNMGYVFANAYLTVIAAAGKGAEIGLSALVRPGGRAPPPVPKQALGMPGREGHEELVAESRWTQRCWTMQEGFYARRALFVFQDTMTWECHCDTWNLAGNDAPAGGNAGPGGPVGKVPGLQRVLSMRGGQGGGGGGKQQQRQGHRKCTGRVYPAAQGFRHPPWPDLDEYARICMEYSSRRITQAQDTLDAFKGFTTVLTKSFAGGFVFGMPVMFLDAALLWRPAASIRRRNMVPTIDSGGMPPVPTWSWMGWFFDGVAPDMSLWRLSADFLLEAASGTSNGKSGGREGGEKEGEPRKRLRSVNGLRIRNLCQFHLTDRATTAPLRNDGWRFRNQRHAGRRSSAPPNPPGWSRSSTGGFRHDSDPHALFRYPVPMASDVPASELPLNGELAYPGTLLSFNTTRAFLDVDFAAPMPAKKSSADGGIPLAVGNLLAPRSGRWVGMLRSHDAWLGEQGANYDGDERIELVAVSEGSERDPGQGMSDVWGVGADMEAVRAHADKDGIVDFVNVLWVERVGGVCYRRGVGHVFLKAWDAFGRERVEVLLG